MKKPACIILAAGKGVRMKSDLPKVFQRILGRPMLDYVISAAKRINPAQILVVVGHRKELILDYYRGQPSYHTVHGQPINFVVQEKQLGTGHAVMQAQTHLENFSGTVLILNGDVPLISAQTLEKLIAFHQDHKSAATVLTTELEDAGHYGRIVRDKAGKIVRIVENKDATSKERAIREINTGTFCFEKDPLFTALEKIRPENAQKEYYLTDTLEIIKKSGLPVYAHLCENSNEVLGVNTQEELTAIEKIIASKS